jgi:hypothetical protein
VTTEPEYQSPREKEEGGMVTGWMERKKKRLVQRKVVGSERGTRTGSQMESGSLLTDKREKRKKKGGEA